MRSIRVLLAFGLVVCFARGGEILTEKEETIKDAEIVSISPKEIVYKVGGKQITKAITDVRKIDFRDVGKIETGKKYSQVDLTDGTTLLVSEWMMKGKNVEMSLLSGPKVKMSKDAINGILNNASEDKDRTDWRNRVINTRGKEAFVMKRQVTKFDKEKKKEVPVFDEFDKPVMVTFNFPATLGDGDEKGETIKASVLYDEKKGPEEVNMKQKDLHGIIFNHTLPPRSPAVICRLADTIGNVIMVAKVVSRKDGITVTTPAGAELEFTFAQTSQIDYTKGRLDYVSALTPNKTTITLNPIDQKDDLKSDHKWYVYKDSNLQMTPIKLGGTSYRHGLTLLPDVELEYPLNGDYRQFDAIVGIDDETKAEGEVTLEIWGDNRKLETKAINYRTTKGEKGEPIKPARPHEKISVSVKDVQTLRIVLKAKDELSGLSISVSLGDARVSR